MTRKKTTRTSKTPSKSVLIRKLLEQYPTWTNKSIAKSVGNGCTPALVSVVRNTDKRNKVVFVPAKVIATPPDMVNSPDHYTQGGIETYDFIRAKKLPYELGNVVKYVSRAPYKGNHLEDLKKAQWYLNAAIRNIEKESK